MATHAGDAVEFSFNLFAPDPPFSFRHQSWHWPCPAPRSVADTDGNVLPTAVLYRNSTATGETITITRTAFGYFLASFTVPSSWTIGDRLELRVTYTISEITETDVIWRTTLSGLPPQVITHQTVPNRGNPDHFGGAQVKAKRPTITIRSGFLSIIHHTLLQDGIPFDFENYGFADSESGGVSEPGPQIKALITERHGCDGTTIYVDLLSAERAQVGFRIPCSVSDGPGVWLMEFYVETSGCQKVFISDAYLYVEPSGKNRTGPPVTAEVRMFLRDYAQENELLDAVDFDGSEIAMAADLCVCEWNELPPPDGTQYTTQSFPFRRHWLIGICSYLFSIAADHYARNMLPGQQAGGISIDDKNKAQMYTQKSMLARQEWQSFVRERKMIDSVNRGGYGEIAGVMGVW